MQSKEAEWDELELKRLPQRTDRQGFAAMVRSLLFYPKLS